MKTKKQLFSNSGCQEAQDCDFWEKESKWGRAWRKFLGCNPKRGNPNKASTTAGLRNIEFGEAEIEFMGPIGYVSKNEKVTHREYSRDLQKGLLESLAEYWSMYAWGKISMWLKRKNKLESHRLKKFLELTESLK